MSDIDNIEYIESIDQGNSYDSMYFLPEQCEQSWNELDKFTLPDSYKNVSSIVFTGMGGSSYGARIIKDLFLHELKIPLYIINDYSLPLFVDKNTLVISASYSGNTKETISATYDALKKNAKIIGVTSGGLLKSLLRKRNKPVYVFDTKFNPSNQPRLGQGYMQMSQIRILKKLGFIDVNPKEAEKIISKLKIDRAKYAKDNKISTNEAKKWAIKFSSKEINIIGAEYLSGAIHAIRNPFHETAKHYANYYLLPELNHHLMEGLKYPETNKDNMLFWFIDSSLYTKQIQKRLELTNEVVTKNKIETKIRKMKYATKLGQVFELIMLGSFITFYLAMLHGNDPAKIPWVDYFKSKLD